MPDLPETPQPIPASVRARLAPDSDAIMDVQPEPGGGAFVQILAINPDRETATPLAHIHLSREQVALYATRFAMLSAPAGGGSGAAPVGMPGDGGSGRSGGGHG